MKIPPHDQSVASVDPLVVRFLVVALAATLAIVVAMIAGFLAWFDGASLAGAALTGGGAFAGALVFILAVAGVLRRGI